MPVRADLGGTRERSKRCLRNFGDDSTTLRSVDELKVDVLVVDANVW